MYKYHNFVYSGVEHDVTVTQQLHAPTHTTQVCRVVPEKKSADIRTAARITQDLRHNVVTYLQRCRVHRQVRARFPPPPSPPSESRSVKKELHEWNEYDKYKTSADATPTTLCISLLLQTQKGIRLRDW